MCESDDKILTNLKASLARLGHEVYELAGGGFLVARWGHSRVCPDACALGAFLRQIGGGK